MAIISKKLSTKRRSTKRSSRRLTGGGKKSGSRKASTKRSIRKVSARRSTIKVSTRRSTRKVSRGGFRKMTVGGGLLGKKKKKDTAPKKVQSTIERIQHSAPGATERGPEILGPRAAELQLRVDQKLSAEQGAQRAESERNAAEQAAAAVEKKPAAAENTGKMSLPMDKILGQLQQQQQFEDLGLPMDKILEYIKTKKKFEDLGKSVKGLSKTDSNRLAEGLAVVLRNRGSRA
tara:strand:+ start:201 stop:899 length:699 start_codon:yes stop_codon:yes gene_type:complete